MTKSIPLRNHFDAKLLVTRASARAMQNWLPSYPKPEKSVDFDFAGIDGMTPSFFDEFLLVLDSWLAQLEASHVTVTLRHPPTKISASYSSLARVHRRSLVMGPDGRWLLESTHAAS